jgi:NADPH:quinone reductase-like Zn-dependent oxidoreductase
MPLDVAAGFGSAARLSYGLMSGLRVAKGSNVLVTAGRSGVSLSLIRLLSTLGVHIHVLTSSQADKQFTDMGVETVFHVAKLASGPGSECEAVTRCAIDVGGFQVIIDPFFEHHFTKLVRTLAPGGRYLSCGMGSEIRTMMDASSLATPKQGALKSALLWARLNEIELRLGTRGSDADLKVAIRDYCLGTYKPVIDCWDDGSDVVSFLSRTFDSLDRFGKVVYRF